MSNLLKIVEIIRHTDIANYGYTKQIKLTGSHKFVVTEFYCKLLRVLQVTELLSE